MDFSQFDARTAADTARPLHLKNPATGEALFADADRKMPCTVLVVGTESRAAQAALRAVQKAKLKGDKKADADQTLEDLHAALVDSAKPLIKGFSNVSRGKEPATLADLDWFLNLQLLNGRPDEQSFVEQIMSFASTRASFLGNGSTA